MGMGRGKCDSRCKCSWNNTTKYTSRSEVGRWSIMIGYEKGNHKIEVRQKKIGRSWSNMAVSNVIQLPQMPVPSINYIDTSHEWVSGRGEPGATVKVHVHGVIIRDVIVDGAGNWSLYIGKQSGGRRIDVQQYKLRKTMVRMGRY